MPTDQKVYYQFSASEEACKICVDRDGGSLAGEDGEPPAGPHHGCNCEMHEVEVAAKPKKVVLHKPKVSRKVKLGPPIGVVTRGQTTVVNMTDASARSEARTDSKTKGSNSELGGEAGGELSGPGGKVTGKVSLKHGRNDSDTSSDQTTDTSTQTQGFDMPVKYDENVPGETHTIHAGYREQTTVTETHYSAAGIDGLDQDSDIVIKTKSSTPVFAGIYQQDADPASAQGYDDDEDDGADDDDDDDLPDGDMDDDDDDDLPDGDED